MYAQREYSRQEEHTCAICALLALYPTKDELDFPNEKRKGYVNSVEKRHAGPFVRARRVRTFSRRSNFFFFFSPCQSFETLIFHRIRCTDAFDILKYSKWVAGFERRIALLKNVAVAGGKCYSNNDRYSMELPLYFYYPLECTDY